MMLQKLVEFADRNRSNTPPSMYQKTRVRWIIDLDNRGNLVGKGLVPTSGGATKGKDRGQEMLMPHVNRSSKIKPKLLADDARYVLGVGDDPKTPQRHQAFCDLIDSCARETGEQSVKAVHAFLTNYPDKAALLPADAEESDILTFRVEGLLPVELASVREFWESYTLEGGAVMQCLICGKRRPVEERLPLKIKGLPGGQTSGVTLISANQDAFESYNLHASLVAPTCRTCAEAFTNSINEMLRSENQKLIVGPTAFVFWTREETGFDPALLLSKPDESDVKQLLESFRTGIFAEASVEPTSFYALSLSASGGRAVVRDWLHTTIPRAQSNLARWFTLQRLLDSSGKPEKPLSVYPLAASLYQRASDQMVANVPRVLVRCALYGDALPDWMLAQAILRNRAEQKVTRPRAALVKIALLSQITNQKEGYMEKLDITCESPGYLCGRLLAELEVAQIAAVNPKSTLVDRYYGAASSAPATVFGNLFRTNRAHMNTLNRDKPNVYHRIEQNLQQILSHLKEFPRTLTLKEQAMFALGYYHQKVHRWAKEESEINNAEEEN